MTGKGITYGALVEDPATPYWVRDLCATLLTKDPVDVLGALEVLTAAAHARLEVITGGRSR